jgi:hypothetical protein
VFKLPAVIVPVKSNAPVPTVNENPVAAAKLPSEPLNCTSPVLPEA